MPIDLLHFREYAGGDPEIVRASERRRCRSGSIVDKIIAKDEEYRVELHKLEQMRKEQNAISKEISIKKKAKEECEDLITKTTKIKKEIAATEGFVQELEIARTALLNKVGNIVHESVRATKNEDENEVLRTWGSIPDQEKTKLAHYEIMDKIEAVNLKKGTEVAGHRGYYLRKYGVMLNQALIQYGLSFLRKRGYTEIQPPFFLRREVMTSTAELADFEETLYKIPDTNEGRDDLFLIATSEQPMCALHSGEYLEARDLPFRYAGYSTCFRKEAGSHGKDMRGIFRIHQFEKVEQFVICEPKQSWDMQEEMIKASEDFYQSLNIPYRVVAIVAGALNDAAARKYDLEAWFPSYGSYRELVSVSNCSDFQSRAVSTRLGVPKMMEREKSYVHMLNGTLCATERTMCCLLEHYQREDGIEVPEPLRPYMDGVTFIPFKQVEAERRKSLADV